MSVSFPCINKVVFIFIFLVAILAWSSITSLPPSYTASMRITGLHFCFKMILVHVFFFNFGPLNHKMHLERSKTRLLKTGRHKNNDSEHMQLESSHDFRRSPVNVAVLGFCWPWCCWMSLWPSLTERTVCCEQKEDGRRIGCLIHTHTHTSQTTLQIYPTTFSKSCFYEWQISGAPSLPANRTDTFKRRKENTTKFPVIRLLRSLPR